MTPGLENALNAIDAERSRLIRGVEPSLSSRRLYPDHVLNRLAELDSKAELFRFITDPDAVTDYGERRRLLDALYSYTRKNALFERGLVLRSGDTLSTDAFDIARFRCFSVPQWWGEVSGEDLEYGASSVSQGREPTFSGFVCLEPGTIIRRSEGVWDNSPYQSFGPDTVTELALVVRQWVELTNDGIAHALNRNEHWRFLVEHPRDLWPVWETRQALQHFGLPYTPSVQTYLEQEHDKRHDPLTLSWGGLPETRPPVVPCRGGMVTTFVLTKLGTYENEWNDARFRLIQQTTAPAGWVTEGLYTAAFGVLEAHTKWVNGLDLGELTISMTSGRPEKNDAINRDIAAGFSRQQVIERHLDRCQKNCDKKGLRFLDTTKRVERRKVVQRCRDKKVL